MNTRYFVLVMGMVLVACSAAAESPPTAFPEATTPPDPTAAPTELVDTEIPPSPTPTDPPPATPTQVPTETQIPIQAKFEWYENNPILPRGNTDEWDNWRVWDSKVVLINGIFHMFYTGAGENSVGIGYAVSSDGLAYTKSDANPIFQPDGEGFDASGVGNGAPLVVGDTWMLYYNAAAAGEKIRSDSGGGSSIGLTTALGPAGPWAEGHLVLSAGGSGEWDSGFILPGSVIVTEDGYRMYYSAGPPGWTEMMCGMATSPDGITWTKYDDPSTSEAPFAESDPVMQPGPFGWESLGVHCSVLKTDSGWEMFYEGRGPDTPSTLTYEIGYASSPDGIHWSKHQDNPTMGEDLTYPSAIKDGSTYYLFISDRESRELLAATGTIEMP